MKYLRHLVILLVLVGGCFLVPRDSYFLQYCKQGNASVVYSNDPACGARSVQWDHYPLVVSEYWYNMSMNREPSPELLAAAATINVDRELIQVDNYSSSPDIFIIYNYTGKMPSQLAVAYTQHYYYRDRLRAEVKMSADIGGHKLYSKFIVHELLHAIGFTHTGRDGSIMNIQVAPGSTIPRDILDIMKTL